MNRPSRRSARSLGLAALVTWTLACSATGSRDLESDRTDRSTTTAPATTTRPDPGTGTQPPRADAPDPDVDDVVDEVFDGLGDPRIDVDHYDVTVRADPGAPEITGTVTLTMSALTADPLPSFTLDLSGPAVSAATVDGTQAKVVVDTEDPGEFEITPARPLRPHEPAEVTLVYAGTPALTTFPGLGVRVGWQQDSNGGWFTMSEPDGTSSWVPVNEHPSDKATWTVSLDTPADAVGVSNGRLVSKEVQGDRRTWVWDTDEPMASYLVLAAVGRYDLVERTGPDDVRIALAFPTDLSARARAGFDGLDDVLTFFAETFGGLPDDDAGAIVVDKALGLALEAQTRPLFGSDAVRAGGVWALAHELAHQWFGNAVSVTSWKDLWLNESFATYADWLYLDHTGEITVASSAGARNRGVPSAGLAVLDPKAAATFDGAVYEGGARALHALRLTIGDEHFFAILRRWFADNDGGNVTTDDFLALCEEVSGTDLGGFFDAWLRSPDQPEFPR